MTFKTKRYGWKPDHPDKRDLRYFAGVKLLKALPDAVDLRPDMPPVVDQGDLGSCTANAACSMVQYVAQKEGDSPLFAPSRLYEYYNTRVLEGTVSYDSGASIRNAIKATINNGFAPESDWPYDIAKFKKKPSTKTYKTGAKHRVRAYHRVPQNLNQIKSVITQHLPVDIGFSVYQSFESDDMEKTGHMPMPQPHEELLGGHSVLLVGFCDTDKEFVARNSWGDAWGDKGYFYMPYDFILDPDYASDFWVINSVP